MAFLRSTTTSLAIAASALPAAAFIFTNPSFFSPQFHSPKSFKPISLDRNSFGFVTNFARSPTSAVTMEAAPISEPISSSQNVDLPELLENLKSPVPGQTGVVTPDIVERSSDFPAKKTEYMVDMTCEGCVNSVKSKLQGVDGVKSVDVDLSNQVVRILGATPVKTMTEALEQTGRKARLIGQGIPEDFLVSAAVAEFKGPDIFGVVRLAQVNMELARIEANFSGLSPGKHGWSINEFGDLTRGAASTGKVFGSADSSPSNEPLGDLGTLDTDKNGETFFSGVKQKLRVSDLIGRSIAVYETEDKSVPGIAAAVVARSAGVGENYKKLCTCDGTTIWESTDRDFVNSKV